MLVRLSVGNFRSIREPVQLALSASSLKDMPSNIVLAPDKRKLVKTAVLYGANASGKSTILRACKALEYLVVRSMEYKPGDKIDPYEPHKLERSFLSLPVTIEAEFFAHGVKYELHISYTSTLIEKEELHFYPQGQKTLLYSRKSGRAIKFGEAYRGGQKTIEKQLLENQLFLSKAAVNNAESVLHPYLFFKEGMMIFPFLNTYRETRLGRFYAKKLAEDENSGFSKKFNKLICALDTGIKHVASEAVDWNDYQFPDNIPTDVKSKIQEEYKYDIKTYHQFFEGNELRGQVAFEVEEESTGTQSLFVIAAIVLDALESGKVLIVDEFEKNLHPGITHYLIQLFHNPLTNPYNAQLIFATHDVTQLSDNTFRRDQIWFTEKNEFGATQLYRGSDIKGMRFNTPLDKWYSSGRLGATPLIDDVEFLLEMQDDATAKT